MPILYEDYNMDYRNKTNKFLGNMLEIKKAAPKAL